MLVQPAGMLAAEILHVPVIGADHVGLERRVVVADEAGPRGRDQEMRVDAFVVHVGDAVFRLRRPARRARGCLRAHPHRGAAGMLGARRGLAEDALERDLAIAIDVPPRRAARRRRRIGVRNCARSGRRLRKPGSTYLSITSADGSTWVSASKTRSPSFITCPPSQVGFGHYTPSQPGSDRLRGASFRAHTKARRASRAVRENELSFRHRSSPPVAGGTAAEGRA